VPLAWLILASAAVPKFVVVPLVDPQAPEPLLDMANFLAQDLDRSGRVESIVWDVTDPTFRDAISSKILTRVPDRPQLPDYVRGAKELGAEYLFLFNARRNAQGLEGEGRLYRDGRPVWRDSRRIRTEVGTSPSMSNEIRSLANTFAARLVQGPLSSLPVVPKVNIPEATPGPIDVPPVTPPPPTVEPAPAPNPEPTPPPNPVVATLERIRNLVKSGERDAALLQAADAVDVYPLDPDVRNLFVERLADSGRFAQSARECARFADLVPNDAVAWRKRAAGFYVQANDLDSARAQLNDALSRLPYDPEARVLMAEVLVQEGRPAEAIAHIDAAWVRSNGPEVRLARALCRTELGGVEGAEQDLKALTESPDLLRREAPSIMNILRATTLLSVDAMRETLAAALRDRTSAAVREQSDDFGRITRARVNLAVALPVPDSQQRDYEHLVLALRLTRQAALNLAGYLDDGDEALLIDARIDLGEAQKALKP
jgi:Flp pilus assembly protein TadD